MCRAEVIKIIYQNNVVKFRLYTVLRMRNRANFGTLQDKLGQIFILAYKLYLPYRISR